MRESCSLGNTLAFLSLPIESVAWGDAIWNHCGFTYSYTRDDKCISEVVSHEAWIWDRHCWTRKCFASSERVFDGKGIVTKRCAEWFQVKEIVMGKHCLNWLQSVSKEKDKWSLFSILINRFLTYRVYIAGNAGGIHQWRCFSPLFDYLVESFSKKSLVQLVLAACENQYCCPTTENVDENPVLVWKLLNSN